MELPRGQVRGKILGLPRVNQRVCCKQWRCTRVQGHDVHTWHVGGVCYHLQRHAGCMRRSAALVLAVLAGTAVRVVCMGNNSPDLLLRVQERLDARAVSLILVELVCTQRAERRHDGIRPVAQ